MQSGGRKGKRKETSARTPQAHGEGEGLTCVAFWTQKESDGRKPNEEDDPSSR